MLELSVDALKKKRLQSNVAGSLKAVRIIKIIAKILMYIGIFGGGAYALLNFLIPSWSLVSVRGVLQKNISWIIISTSFISVPTLLPALLLNILASNLAGVSNSARMEEHLVITDENICYSYREKHQMMPSERFVIKIGFDQIDSVTFEDNTNLMLFTGKIRREYFDSYPKSKPAKITTLDEFTICDYFSPSLKEVLLNKKIHIDS